jgi:uncharacterized membrane protein YjgN (DUF898 family)
MDSASQKTTPIIFKGNTSEYFGIWIVNLLLTIVTLGIYSAWAKVRRKKYFYNNTLIEDVGFDYHARPIAILKGRAIAFVFFIIYVSVKSTNPMIAGALLMVLFLLIPWLVVRGSIFNARNSSHRGLRFDFVGTVNEAAKVFIGLGLLTAITLGLAAPYAAHQRNQFLAKSHRFGLSQFEMERVVKQFYKVYLVVFLLPFIGIVAAIAIPAYQQYVKKTTEISHSQSTESSIPNAQPFVPIHQPANIVVAVNEVTEIPAETDSKDKAVRDEAVYSENATAVEDSALNDVESAIQAEEVTVVDEIAQIEELTEEEQQKIIDELLQKQHQKSADTMRDILKNPQALLVGVLAGLGVLITYLLFLFGFAGYLQARIGNLVWNNISLDKLTFKSTLRARDFIWLYFSNVVLIMLTFGLATPWAQIRMVKYRTSKLAIIGDVDFDQFVGDKKAEVKATGEEMAEMFDVDLSFG